MIRAAFLTLLVCGAAHAVEASPNEVLKTIDERLHSPGDYKAIVHVQETLRDGAEQAYELYVYRRDATRDLLVLLTQPKANAGTGFLRIERNVWEYDPATGQWERKTIRTNIGGSSTHPADFDTSNLSGDYVPSEEPHQQLGKVDCRVFKLTAKPDADPPYPSARIWVDKELNVLKKESYAASGKLLRSELSPEYNKVKAGGKDLYFAKEIFIYDAERGSKGHVQIMKVDLRPLEANVFTKGWLEARSR